MEIPTASTIAKHLELKPTSAERKSGYKAAASLVEAIVDKGMHTWIDLKGDAQTAGCWAVVTVRGSKHYIAKSEVT